jgi:carbonic anhydrase
LLAKVVQANSDGRPRGDFAYAVLQHTGCGIRSLTAFPDLLAEYFEIAAGDLEAKAVTDPFAAVRVDVGILRQALPAGVFVSGLLAARSRGS